MIIPVQAYVKTEILKVHVVAHVMQLGHGVVSVKMDGVQGDSCDLIKNKKNYFKINVKNKEVVQDNVLVKMVTHVEDVLVLV